MRLIDTNALRDYFKINEHCEECHWNNRDCSKPPYYSLRDICAAIDEIPTIPAISVEWLRNLCTIAEMETDDEMFIDWLIQTWQKEQEVQDG